MSGLVEVTGPAVEPISRNEAREHLRLDDDVDDSQVRAYITAARIWAENYTGRKFINTTVDQFFDVAGRDPLLREGIKTGYSGNQIKDGLELGLSPVASVSEIYAYDDENSESVWDASNYYVDTAGMIARVVLRDGGSWPTDLRNANGIKVRYVVGFGTSPNSVPEPIRLAIMQYMTFAYEHRGDFERYPPPTPPAILTTLLQPYRVVRFI